MVAEGGGRERGDLLFRGYRISVLQDKKKFWKWIGVVVSQQCEFA